MGAVGVTAPAHQGVGGALHARTSTPMQVQSGGLPQFDMDEECAAAMRDADHVAVQRQARAQRLLQQLTEALNPRQRGRRGVRYQPYTTRRRGRETAAQQARPMRVTWGGAVSAGSAGSAGSAASAASAVSALSAPSAAGAGSAPSAASAGSAASAARATAFVRGRPYSPYFHPDDDTDDPTPDLNDDEINAHRQLQIIGQHIRHIANGLTVSVGKHQRSLRARVQREEAGNSPIAVVKNLTAIYAKAAAVKKQPELFKTKCEELYEAVRSIHRRRTVISWTKTAERQKNYHGKVKEYERILRDTLSSISLSISPPDSAS